MLTLLRKKVCRVFDVSRPVDTHLSHIQAYAEAQLAIAVPPVFLYSPEEGGAKYGLSGAVSRETRIGQTDLKKTRLVWG